MYRCLLLIVSLLSLVLSNPARAQYVRVGPLGGVSLRGAQGAIDVLPLGLGTRVRGPQLSVDTGVYGLLAGPRTYNSGYASSYGRYASGYGRVGAYPVIATPVLPIVPVFVSPVIHVPVVHVPVVAVPVYAPPIFIEPAFTEPYFAEPVFSEPYEVGRVEALPSSPEVWIDPSGIGMTSFEQVVDVPYAESVDDRLRSAVVRLRNSLAMRRDDADVWLKYLGPDAILEALDNGTVAKTISELLKNYEGVAGNGDLTHIWSVDGFWQTHQALRDWREPVNADSTDPDSTDASDSGESVLEPKQDATPDARSDTKADEKKSKEEPSIAEELPVGEAETLPAPVPDSPFSMPPSE